MPTSPSDAERCPECGEAVHPGKCEYQYEYAPGFGDRAPPDTQGDGLCQKRRGSILCSLPKGHDFLCALTRIPTRGLHE